MKYIKQYENFKEIYNINPGDGVMIKEEYLSKILEYWSRPYNFNYDYTQDELRLDYLPKLFKDKIGTFVNYNQDDFFGNVKFIINDQEHNFMNIPVYMLISEYSYNANKFNI